MAAGKDVITTPSEGPGPLLMKCYDSGATLEAHIQHTYCTFVQLEMVLGSEPVN